MKQCRHNRFSLGPILKTMAAGALALGSSLCLAGDIYHWVDEQGHTHMADSVPERYKEKAIKMDSKRFELPASDRLAAAARVAKERERQAALDAERARAEAAEAAERRVFVPSPAASHPAGKPGNEPAAPCDRLWDDYFKSQECFAPYRTVNGIKAEAFEHCKDIASPAPQCGLQNKIGAN